jgi:hypothetical protein
VLEYLLALRSYWLFLLHRIFRLTVRDVSHVFSVLNATSVHCFPFHEDSMIKGFQYASGTTCDGIGPNDEELRVVSRKSFSKQ